MSKTINPDVNKWKEYHEYLVDEDSKEFQKQIMAVINCSQASFFRYLKMPSLLSIAEKKAIAEVYKLPTHFLFPELTPENV